MADALSRKEDSNEKLQAQAISIVQTPWLQELKNTLLASNWYRQQVLKIHNKELAENKYKLVNNLVFYNEFFLIDRHLGTLLHTIIRVHHSTPHLWEVTYESKVPLRS